ncbi:sugar phosphate isomerase/epimerase family protein [Paenibacillus allorhizosphaerae]|uniref:Inosose dehydratase n=1 Tax=Paenibacillus allorhizosphaerae TaxID=2849866 RepID=A0ABM8VAX6_9BACL|nr:sugar phosphate isomerase/epimerase [Paenibacillus allorhizosphaerae]CAG7616197.1 Inosose dehydratase [Paenibacillus allorhizosphaerae]
MERTIAVQTQLWGNSNLDNDFTPIYDDVIRAGYDGVESRFTVLQQKEKLRRYLSENPLQIFALHTSPKAFYDGDIKPEFAELLKDMNGFSIPNLLFSPAKYETMEEERELLHIIDQMGERCADRGIRLSYHNHAWEFEKFGYDLFDAVMEFKHIGIALDTGWLFRAGYPLEATVNRYRERIGYVHLKDTTKEQWKELGTGDANVAETTRILDTLGLDVWTIEQDNSKLHPLESATISLNYFKRQFQS